MREAEQKAHIQTLAEQTNEIKKASRFKILEQELPLVLLMQT